MVFFTLCIEIVPIILLLKSLMTPAISCSCWFYHLYAAMVCHTFKSDRCNIGIYVCYCFFNVGLSLSRDSEAVRQGNGKQNRRWRSEDRAVCASFIPPDSVREEGLRASSAVIWAGRRPGSLLPPRQEHPQESPELVAWQMMSEKIGLIKTKDSVCQMHLFID